MKVLVTGGVRSGKSFHAESLLIASTHVTYVAPGPPPDEAVDPDWAARVESHRARRPEHWATVETQDLAAAVRDAEGDVLIDCLGTWLTALLDELDGWDQLRDEWEPVLLDRVDETARAIAEHEGTVVVVTNEVGMGVVPEQRSGRLFRDLLGVVNQGIAEECDDVLLVISGRVLRL
ncbi:bifunctional adenosylcobinamide kinase/adenosylcobinamide-phosphate guanylyltransferase [Aeromicrobium sp. SMF47]|uniref:Adenosylcobinamide kinase n=1 Tax=Aeromicrobium yanjiei TaxID=2662028 RepID=A0A5Q2MM63_9ACTN|nr:MULTISPECIES: bifunctional adenosylcobinamide kinase/adenosylcobinamide-phosphate guanylyltransferase [Aeromicrobium]MRJ75962.1 bifunctional adenosylcobinamide kinase/adenosylcobinamide-phosphate guanylyltransferase [Aeromicrobium yanjiei]MRK00311.1 bifunctional adenosylcobinamide kinase/adenosylcobinamide-phosphate guanylyltransferase [Aeromicrobium sp. S22]QGG42803.1 bifunctional adenosylcobinamide kinase/adenosylcobinamide-phosphate guanylyltransferase [Aeromicrobium yanjiei]